MTKNMSNIDRGLRFLLAIAVAVLYYTNVIGGTTAIILGVVAIIFAVTSFVSFCPLYRILGISTCKVK
jgi:hypothetical protein